MNQWMVDLLPKVQGDQVLHGYCIFHMYVIGSRA